MNPVPMHSTISNMRYQRQTAPYSHCQLVAAFNALLFYGRPAPRQHGKRFERFIDLTYARHGSCIAVRRAHYELGLKTVPIAKNIQAVRRHVDQGRPVEIAVDRAWAGLHATLVVGREDRDYLVTNWNKHETISRVAVIELRKGQRFNTVRAWCYFELVSPHPNAFRPCATNDCVGWVLKEDICDYCKRQKGQNAT